MFNMDAPCTFHIRKVSPSILGHLLCPSQYVRLITVNGGVILVKCADMICLLSIHGICWSTPGAGHDDDDDVLFNGERPRIERDTEKGNIRQITSPQLADRETEQLGYVRFITPHDLI
jgi:hypothetical protein